MLIVPRDVENDGGADPRSTANKQDEIGDGSGKVPDKRGQCYQGQQPKERTQAKELDPSKMIFLDESGSNIALTRLHTRAKSIKHA